MLVLTAWETRCDLTAPIGIGHSWASSFHAETLQQETHHNQAASNDIGFSSWSINLLVVSIKGYWSNIMVHQPVIYRRSQARISAPIHHGWWLIKHVPSGCGTPTQLVGTGVPHFPASWSNNGEKSSHIVFGKRPNPTLHACELPCESWLGMREQLIWSDQE